MNAMRALTYNEWNECRNLRGDLQRPNFLSIVKKNEVNWNSICIGFLVK